MHNNQQILTFQVEEKQDTLRIDKFLASQIPDYSRSKIQEWISQGLLVKDDVIITNGAAKLEAGIYQLTIPQRSPLLLAEYEFKLNFVYEDEHLLVVDKPAGLTVHPGAGNQEQTMVNALLAQHRLNLSSLGGIERPGIVHRLDKDTSGLIIVAKTDLAHKHLAAQLAERTLSRTYQALCLGIAVPPLGTISHNILRSTTNRLKMSLVRSGGRTAVTHYHTIERLVGDTISLIECKLETGRTHQIRLHLSSRKLPIIGDKLYGNLNHASLAKLDEELKQLVKNFPRQALHAKKLAFIHPVSEELIELESNLPTDMEQLLLALKHGN